MKKAKLTILGSGSARPNINRFHTSQVFSLRDKQFLIDCGEGAQVRISQYHVNISRLNHIFISHLHGDHCFGLVPLLSTLGMLGRTADIVIHSHPDLERLLKSHIDFFLSDFPFKVVFAPFSTNKPEVIYEDRSLTVTTIPLKHKIPTCGFLFREKPTERHLIRAMLDAYEVPIACYKDIKAGADYITPDGEVVANKRLTTDPTPSVSYAYMSDTVYSEKYLDLVRGVDCLYHETTFLSQDKVRMMQTMHSSAEQAATFARKAGVGQLIIGHYSARYNNNHEFLKEAKQVFLNTFLADDGAVFEF